MKTITNPRICKPTVKNLKDGKIKYYCQFTYYVDKDRKTGRSNTFDTPKEAIQNAQLKIDRIMGDAIASDTSKYTVEDVANHYIDDMLNKKRKIKETTRETSISTMRSLVMCKGTLEQYTPVHIRNKQVQKLTASDINGWLNRIYNFYDEGSISGRTYTKMRSAMNELINYANRILCFEDYDRYVQLVSVFTFCNHKVRKNNNSINRAKRIVNDEQFLRLLDDGKYFKNGQYPMPDIYEEFVRKYKKNFIMDCRYYMLFSVLFYTGMRMSEARPLRMSDVKFEDVKGEEAVKISIDKAKSGKCAAGRRKQHREAEADAPKTKTAIRKVFVMGPFVSAFDQYYTDLEYYYEQKGIEDGLLFPSKTDGEMSDHAVDEKLKRWHRRIESEVEHFTKHDFRRSRITIMLKKGHKIDEITEFIGHTEEKIIKDYYDARDAEDRFKITSTKINKDDFSYDYQWKVALEDYENKKE